MKEKESLLRKESVHQKKEDKLIKINNVTDALKEALCELQQRFIDKFKSSTEKGKERERAKNHFQTFVQPESICDSYYLLPVCAANF